MRRIVGVPGGSAGENAMSEACGNSRVDSRLVALCCVALVSVTGCKPGAKDVIKLVDSGDVAGITKMLASEDEAQVAAVAEAWCSDPRLLKLSFGVFMDTKFPAGKIGRFFRMAAKCMPADLPDFAKGTAKGADSASAEEAARFFVMAAEAADAAATAGKQDLACTPAEALSAYIRQISALRDLSPFDETLARAFRADCEGSGLRAKLLNDVTVDYTEVDLALTRAISNLHIAFLAYQVSALRDAEAKLKEIRAGVSRRYQANEAPRAASLELQRLVQQRAACTEIWGYIVASLGDNTYEATGVTWSTPMGDNGWAQNTHPRALIIGRTSTFESRGRFGMCAKDTGTREVQTKDGFTKTVHVWEETGSPEDLDRAIAEKRQEVKAAKQLLQKVTAEDEADRKAASQVVLLAKVELLKKLAMDLSTKNPAAGDPSAVSRGGQLFRDSACASCHGFGAEGSPGLGPSLKGGTFLGVKGDLTDAAYFMMISDGSEAKGVLGRPGWKKDGMSAFRGRLSNSDIWAVVAWIRAQQTSKAAK